MRNFTKARLTIACWLLVTLLLAQAVNGQSYARNESHSHANQASRTTEPQLKGNVTFQSPGMSLADILAGIERQSKYVFIYTDEEIPVSRLFSLNVVGQPIQTFLPDLLSPLDVKYKIFGKQIVLTGNKPVVASQEPVEDAPVVAPETAQVIAMPEYVASYNAVAAFEVRGTVKDESDQGLPGVNILEKGTTNGTVSDAEGNFALSVSNESAVLVFSYIGYAAQDVPINGQSTISVRMTPDVATLGEVVVVGYGEQKRSDLTGSVSSVKSEEIRNMPARSLNEAIQGRVAGVQITKESGAPGSGSNIVIRGVGSTNGMGPLYIVDGVRMGTGYNFNIQDVESIEILKDASAAAIYGSQAAGGVILVTTKRGAKDQMQVSFNSYVGVRQPINMYDLLGTPDYIAAKSAFGLDVSTWGDPNELPNTDWVDEVFDNGMDQSYSLSLAGGSEHSKFYASASYQHEKGIRIDNSFKRYSLRLNSDHDINKKVKVGQSLYVWKGSFNPQQSGNIPFRSAPTQLVYDESNEMGGWGKTPPYFAGGNPVGSELLHHRVDETNAVEGNVYLDYRIVNNFSVRGTVGGALIGHYESDFAEAYDFGAFGNTSGVLSKLMWQDENFTANAVATYSKEFGMHALKVMAGYEMYREDRSNLKGEASGFATSIAESFALNNNSSSQRVPEGGVFQNKRLLSQFGRINYSYADKYLLTANIRHDGNDRFAPKHRWGWFPSVSVGWKITEEPFMQAVTFLNLLKLRAGYGVLGNDGSIDAFVFQGSYGPQNRTGLPDGSTVIGYGLNPKVPNNEIQWEEVSTVDIGVDATLLDGKLNATVDYYSRQTRNMLYDLAVPLSAGLSSSVPVNVGQMSNRGLEVSLDYNGKAGDFTYRLGANASFNRNEVSKLDGTDGGKIDDGSVGEYVERPVNRTTVGQPIGQFYGYVVEGIYSSDQAVTERGVTQAGAGAGDLIFKDIVADGVITPEDKTFIGNPWPKATYGITATLGWRGFDMSLLFQGTVGQDVYNGARHSTEIFADDGNTTSDIFGASFFNGNGLTDQPRVGYTNASGNYVRDPNGNYTKISSYFVEDASFLRLRNLQIGYSLPASLNDKIGLSRARVYFMAENVFTITSYSGMDPEVFGSGFRNNRSTSGTTARGIDTINAYPRTRLLSLGIDLTF